MATLIRHQRIARDDWLRLEAKPWLQVGESGLVPDFPADGALLVPIELWRLRRNDLIVRAGRLGLAVEAWDEPESFADALPHLQLVAIRIAQFTDGRAYSLARLLRERHGYRGELRATGEVLRDQLAYLARCGFDAFALRNMGRADEALGAFAELSAHRAPYPRALATAGR
jgi:uncharacterized protein (DUF934 family)